MPAPHFRAASNVHFGASVLVALRAPLARLIAAFNAAPLTARVRDIAQRAGIAPERLVVLETSDEGFVGGWSGIAPRTLLLPARWVQLPDEALLTQDIVTQFGQPPYRIDLLNAIDGVTFAEVWKGAVAVAIGQHQVRVIGLHELKKNKRASGRKKDKDDLRRLDSMR